MINKLIETKSLNKKQNVFIKEITTISLNIINSGKLALNDKMESHSGPGIQIETKQLLTMIL